MKKKEKIEEKVKPIEIKEEKHPLLTFELWAKASGLKPIEWSPRKIYALKNGVGLLSKDDWNKFFESY